MKVFIDKLCLYTNDGEMTTIGFSKSLTFIYGNMGVGKSTLLNLVNYCMGGTLIETPAVKQCLKAAQIELVIEKRLYTFFRKKGSSTIIVEDKGKNEKVTMHFRFLTQYVLTKIGLPVKTIAFEGSGEKKIERTVTLSLINFGWFSYLPQLEMDSNFFNLNSDNLYKKTAAVNVLFTFLENSIMSDEKRNEMNRHIRKLIRQYGDSEQVFEYVEKIFSDIYDFVYDEEAMLLQLMTLRMEKNNYSENEVEKMLQIQKVLTGLEYWKQFNIRRNSCRKKMVELQDQLRGENRNVSSQSKNQNINNHRLNQLFLDCLKNVGFPGLSELDEIKYEKNTYMPIIYNRYTGKEVSFENLGSGGKRTIFKICFALAVHRFHSEKKENNYLPSFFVLDTPMKNISEKEDKIKYDRFYQYILQLFSSELSDTQLIIVENKLTDLKMYANKDNAIIKHMTDDIGIDPPLFKHYRGY